MSNPDLVGWDLLYKLAEKAIKTECDVLIAIIHWFLIKNAGFRCLGIGDQKTLDENAEGTEFLPDHWNDNSASYTLRYVHDDQVYVLLGTVSNNTIIVNLLPQNNESHEIGNCAFNITNTVKSLKGSLRTLVPDIEAILVRLKKELLEKIVKDEARRTAHTQTTTEDAPPSNLLRNDLPSSLLAYDIFEYARPRPYDPVLDVGRGDLDPLGRGGGGMLFHPPGIAINARPGPNFPHARFDPFGPPDSSQPGRRPRAGQDPDPDHLPVPGYDDMFL